MLQSAVISLFLVLLLSGCAAPDTQPPPGGGSPKTAYSSIPGTAQQGEASTDERERWLADTDPQAMKVLEFWFEEWGEDLIHGGKGNYNDKWFPHGPLGAEGSKEIDREITEHFVDLFEEAVNGRLDWEVTANPYENLAFILLIDQFARNMFRGTPEAYQYDQLALDAARLNVEKGFYNYYFTGYQRLFVVYPLMHHESLASQEMCLYLLKAINEQPGHQFQFLNAMQKGVEHYQVVFMFGRFPHRNERLGRKDTQLERAYLGMKGTQGFVDGSKW
jgi:uncharacterized protein (DUF924 family)